MSGNLKGGKDKTMKFNVYATSREYSRNNNTLRKDYGKILSKYGAKYHFHKGEYIFENRWECSIELDSLEDLQKLLKEIREYTQQEWIKLILVDNSTIEIYDDWRE